MPADYAWPDREDRAEALAPVADELVLRIRTDDPTALCLELLARYDWWEMAAVACILAARVDPHEDEQIQVGWVRHRDVLENPRPIRVDLLPDDLTPTEIDTLIWALSSQGRTQVEIARRLGLSQGTVSDRLHQMRERSLPVSAGVAR